MQQSYCKIIGLLPCIEIFTFITLWVNSADNKLVIFMALYLRGGEHIDIGAFLSAQYLVNQWFDAYQIFMDI